MTNTYLDNRMGEIDRLIGGITNEKNDPDSKGYPGGMARNGDIEFAIMFLIRAKQALGAARRNE